MTIYKIDNSAISEIRHLWEELNSLHEKLSTHSRRHFANFSFEERVRVLRERDSFAVFAAKENGCLIGYCISSVKGTNGEIDSIFVDSRHRNTGIGEQLVASAEAWLKERNVDKIHVHVAEGNESVLDFYEKLGFLHRFTVLEKKA